jgi:coenzyme F420-reducing hydrogenase delta subunit
MFNLSAAMAGEFVNVTKNMSERIEGLGPSKLRMMDDGGGTS